METDSVTFEFHGIKYRFDVCDDCLPCEHCDMKGDICDEYIDEGHWMACGQVFSPDKKTYCKRID